MVSRVGECDVVEAGASPRLRGGELPVRRPTLDDVWGRGRGPTNGVVRRWRIQTRLNNARQTIVQKKISIVRFTHFHFVSPDSS